MAASSATAPSRLSDLLLDFSSTSSIESDHRSYGSVETELPLAQLRYAPLIRAPADLRVYKERATQLLSLDGLLIFDERDGAVPVHDIVCPASEMSIFDAVAAERREAEEAKLSSTWPAATPYEESTSATRSCDSSPAAMRPET